jgi:hypothetical protein
MNHGALLLWTLKSGKFGTSHLPIISRAPPSPTGNREEQQIQPIRNKEKAKNRF